MSKNKKSEVESFLANEFGHYFEEMGAKTLLGRIYGLLISQTRPVSLKEIAEKLMVSKPAVSTTIKVAVQMGMFQKKYIPEAPREDFYILNYDTMEMIIDPGIRKLQIMIDKLSSAIQLIEEKQIDNDDPAFLEKVRKMRELYKIILEEYHVFGDRIKERIKLL